MSESRPFIMDRSLIPAHCCSQAAALCRWANSNSRSIVSIILSTFSAYDRGTVLAGAMRRACSTSDIATSRPKRGRLFHIWIVSASSGTKASVMPWGRFRRMAATVSSVTLATWLASNRICSGTPCSVETTRVAAALSVCAT